MPRFGFGFGPVLTETVLGRAASGAPVNTALPVISGSTVQGQTLSTTNGTWTNSPTSFAYQWFSGASPVGTNANTYVLQASDVGRLITVVVTATNAHGSGAATSAAAGPVTSGATATGTPLGLLLAITQTASGGGPTGTPLGLLLTITH